MAAGSIIETQIIAIILTDFLAARPLKKRRTLF
jgi:hypothetical protein